MTNFLTSKVSREVFADEAGELDCIDHDALDYADLLDWREVMDAEEAYEIVRRRIADDDEGIDLTPGPLAKSLDGQVACSVCNAWLRAGELVQNHPVYKCGELNYIEIHHARCTSVALYRRAS